MKKFQVKTKFLFPVLLTIIFFVLGCINAWSFTGDVIFRYDGSRIDSYPGYSAKSGDYTNNGITMTLSASLGYNNSGVEFWLGSNSDNSNIANSTLSSYPSIASAVGLRETKQRVAALVFEKNLINVGKITYSHTSCQPNSRIALVCSVDNGSSYIQLGGWQNLSMEAESIISFEFPTIPVAQYAIVVDKKTSDSKDYIQNKVPMVTFYEGDTYTNYVITPTWDNSLGNVELQGTVLIVTPNDCVEYGSPVYEIISGTAIITQKDNLFVVEAQEDIMIQINFSIIPGRRVILDTGDVLIQDNCLSALDLPEVMPLEDCIKEGWEFAGWSEKRVDDTTSNVTLIPAGIGTYVPQENVTLHAVYKKTERIDLSYNLITNIDQLESGFYLLGTLVNSVYHFFDGSISSGNGNSIFTNNNRNKFETIPLGAVEVTLVSTSERNQYAFKIGSDYLESSGTGSGNLRLSSTNTTPWTLSFSGSSLSSVRYSVPDRNVYLRGFQSSPSKIVTFRTYVSNANEPVALFKKTLTPIISYNSDPNCSIISDITWIGSFNDDWSTDMNWAPPRVPTEEKNVIIPSKATYFPALKGNGDAYKCNNITFEMGGQIGRIDLLNYNKAHVQLNFGIAGMTDYWHMLSMPIRNVLVGDLAFGRAPSVFLRRFDANVSDNGSWMKGNWSDYKTSNIESFGAAEGFIFWVNGTNYNSENLAAVNNILELPCFENTDEMGTNISNPYHHYDATDKKSTFDLFNSRGEVTGKEAPYNRDLIDDYRFIYEEQGAFGNVSYPILFGNTDLALVGNPYLSSIDFDAFQYDNGDNITESYQIWTGTGFSVYTKGIGYSGDVNVDQYIAPMQSFIVEKRGVDSSPSLIFNVANVSVVAPRTSDSKLRTSENNIDKLDIIASNGSKSILTFIANRSDGAEEFGFKDSRKLLLGISNTPEVYTIKDSPSGKVGVGVNIVNTHEISVPIGLATKYSGDMTLTFDGMENYNANIFFIDKETGTLEDITGKATYEYTFNYTPPQKEDVEVANEDRFVVQFTPMATGLDKRESNTQIQAYYKDDAIFITSNLLNPIKQVMVYNAQGILIYNDENVNATDCIIPTPIISSICIIKLITENEIANLKILK